MSKRSTKDHRKTMINLFDDDGMSATNFSALAVDHDVRRSGPHRYVFLS